MNNLKVFKFGGASVNSAERIHNLANIIQQHNQQNNLVVIISAMGKTTNALEKIAETFYANKSTEALHLFENIKQLHINTAKDLLNVEFKNCEEHLQQFFTEIDWLLHDKPVRNYNYYYDQIVCIGELLSTCIISYFLKEKKIENNWIDVRDLLRTDNNFRDANIDWKTSETLIKSSISVTDKLTIVQGFIGCSDENESTTLGREGSDYTAAIFANILNAESLTIWKDVEGVMNADPKQFPQAQLISELSFDEVIEMAYYGAQVIHPKTIKPLQNKAIPLLVKCFLNTELKGTIIQKNQPKKLPPIIVQKNNQVLMHLHSKDFSFVGEQPMAQLYNIFSMVKLKPNLIQTGAISVQICLDDIAEKIDTIAFEAEKIFDVEIERGLELLTVRHFTKPVFDDLTKEKNMLLQQQTTSTIQALYKAN